MSKSCVALFRAMNTDRTVQMNDLSHLNVSFSQKPSLNFSDDSVRHLSLFVSCRICDETVNRALTAFGFGKWI